MAINNNINQYTHSDAVKYIRHSLLVNGIKTKIVTIAKKGSCYIKFNNDSMGKIRVGDHNERKRYGYRWQIRSDITMPKVERNKGHSQFYYPISMLDHAIQHMINYYNKINRTENE